jgi:hypothetical protein
MIVTNGGWGYLQMEITRYHHVSEAVYNDTADPIRRGVQSWSPDRDVTNTLSKSYNNHSCMACG